MTKKVYKIHKIWGLVCGGLLLLTAWVVNHSVASPYVLLHNTESLTVLPPLWFLGLLWYGAYFVSGWVLGLILSLAPLPCELNVKRYRGSMLLIISLSLSVAWYLLLFGTEAFFLSWIVMALSVVSGSMAAFSFLELTKGSAFLILVVQGGCFLLFLLQFMVMLHI